MKKVIAAILAAVVLLAAGVGIGYKLFSYKTEKEKTKKIYDEEISVTYADLKIGDSLFLNIDKYPDRWGKALTKIYGMSEEQKNSILETPENWLAFTFFINVNNPNDKEILVNGLDVPDNGKNGLFFQSVLDGQPVVEKNVSVQLPVYVFLEDNEPSLEEVEQMIKKLDIYIKYIPMPEDLDAEIPEESYQKAKVEF